MLILQRLIKGVNTLTNQSFCSANILIKVAGFHKFLPFLGGMRGRVEGGGEGGGIMEASS